MTEATTPLEAAFEMQRESINQGQRLFEQGLDLQQDAAETFLQNGLAVQRATQQQGVDLVRQLVYIQVDAAESVLDEAESDVQAAIGQQFEEFLHTQADTWDALKADVLEAIEDLTERQEALFTQSVEAVIDAQQQAEQQTVEGIQQTGETIQMNGEPDVSGADHAGNSTQQQVVAQPDLEYERLEDIEGLGSTYADRLRDHGIESLTHLVEANPETIADAADVSESRAETWITAAQA